MNKRSRNPSFVRMVAGLAAAAIGGLVAPNLFAQQKKTTVIAGERYTQAPGGQHRILGKNYRSLWAAPIEVEVLDLQTEAGGLRPVMRVGGMQTLGLAMKGKDGRDYTFRGVDKGVTDILPEEFQGTGVEAIAQDQISAGLPGSDVVVPPLAEAVGVLHVEARLVVMPDDPALGEFRRDFAGVLGTFMEYPGAISDTHPGFRGATEVIGHPQIWSRLNAGPELRVDTRAYLRARLLDLLLGDWDRHRKQWRWAEISGKEGLQPIPEDRDQAFADYEGLVLDMARMSGATLVKFEEEYSAIGALTTNGWDVDRYILTDLAKAEWMAIAREVQSRVTDEVIDEALHRMPPEYYELRGADLTSTLRARRDKLLEIAEKYYLHRADKVDIYGTAKDERVVLEQFDNDDVEVTIALDGAGEKSYYRRRFTKDETHELRVYLQGGNDHVETRGQKGGGIKIRVIGGPGNDVVDDSQGRGVNFYDFEGDNRIEGNSGTGLNTKPYRITGREDEVPYVPSRDWGRFTKPLIIAGYHADPGLFLGAGFDTQGYGFRKKPWGTRHILSGGFAIKAKKPYLDYKGDYRRENAWLHGAFHVRASGIDQLRYYGLGNNTTNELEDEAYKISDFQFSFFPALEISKGVQARFSFGPIIKYSDSSGTKEDTVLAQEQPYGFETFGELGLQAAFAYDGTDPRNVLGGGIKTRVAGAYFAEVWDVDEPFGSFEGEFKLGIPLGRPVQLSFYGGGKKLWGDFPFFEAAYIGGGITHGYNWNRFAGDASLYGGIEFRWAFAKLSSFVVPMEIGLTLGADAGRVWLDGEDSDTWHPGYGGGIFIAPFNRLMLFEIGFGKSDEKTFFVFGGNLRVIGF